MNVQNFRNIKKISISFDEIRLKINPSQFEIFNPNQNSIRLNPRLPIRMNLKEVFNPNKSEIRIVNPQSESIRIIATSDSLELKNLSGFNRIQSLRLTISRIDFISICIE